MHNSTLKVMEQSIGATIPSARYVLVCYELFNFLRVLQIYVDCKMIQIETYKLDNLLF